MCVATLYFSFLINNELTACLYLEFFFSSDGIINLLQKIYSAVKTRDLIKRVIACFARYIREVVLKSWI